MIKASYLHKQAAKYRELARGEVSLETRRQLFALAARCDEIATGIGRWPLPKTLVPPTPPKKLNAAPAGGQDPILSPVGPIPSSAGPIPSAAGPSPAGPSAAGKTATLPFPDRLRARLVHRFEE